MSIIAETLHRLESDNAGSPDPLELLRRGGNGVRRSSARRGRFPLRSVAVLLLVLGGAGLAAWYWAASPEGAIEPSLVESDQPARPDAPAAQAVATLADATPARSEPPVLPAADNTPSDRADPAASPPEAATASDKRPRQTPALSAAVPAGRPSDEALAVIGIDPAVVEAEPVQLAGQTSGSSNPQPGETAPPQPLVTQPSAAPVTKQAGSPAKPAAPVREEATTTQKPAAPVLQEAPAVAEKPAKPPVKPPAKARPETVAKAAAAAVARPAAAKPRPAKTKAVPVQARKAQQVQTVVPKQDRDAVDATMEQARIALSRGQYFQALDALQALSPAPEKRADFWLLKGSSHLGLGQLDLAEQAFTKAQPLAPGNAQVAIQLAILKQETGDHTMCRLRRPSELSGPLVGLTGLGISPQVR